MKSLKFLTLLTLIALSISSCKPIYKCGESKPEERLLITKRFQTVIDERDQLCKTLERRNSEIVSLNQEIDNLKSSIGTLETKYKQLSDNNLSQAELFNETLRKKSEELNEKERLLIEREKTLKELQDVIARQQAVTQRLNDLIRNALLGFQSDELQVEIKDGKVYVSMTDKLLFKSGSAAVEEKGRQALRVLAEVLSKNPEIDILVEGHTDNIPIRTAMYRDNWDLSVARAVSIVRILTDDFKIDATRLTASGRGEFMPRASNATPQGRAMNRRTDIILSPKLDEIMKLLKN